MSASINDKITDVRNGGRPNSARVVTARTVGGSNLACNDLSGWPTTSKVHFATYQIDTNSNPIPNTQLDCYGIVSGNTITQMVVVDGTDGGSSVGDVVEMLPTAAWGQDLADALTREHYRDGTHENINADSVTTGTLNTSAFHSATKSLIFEQIYPVGSIYINASVSTNPATLLGFGTWTAFGSGRVPVGYNASDSNFNAAEKTGGASTNTHNHWTGISFDGGGLYVATTDGSRRTRVYAKAHMNPYGAANVGGNLREDSTYDEEISILQPYITVYMWKRTA